MHVVETIPGVGMLSISVMKHGIDAKHIEKNQPGTGHNKHPIKVEAKGKEGADKGRHDLRPCQDAVRKDDRTEESEEQEEWMQMYKQSKDVMQHATLPNEELRAKIRNKAEKKQCEKVDPNKASTKGSERPARGDGRYSARGAK